MNHNAQGSPCRNAPPGQQPDLDLVDVTSLGGQQIAGTEDGTADFQIVTEQSEGEGVCEPPVFKPVVFQVEFDGVTITIEQGDCTVQLECELDVPIEDGDALTVDVGSDRKRIIISS